MLTRHGILNSSAKYHKAGSPFSSSVYTKATRDTDNTAFPASPLKANKNMTSMSFPIQSASPERGPEGLLRHTASHIERVKDQEVFDQYRDRNACFYKKNNGPPENNAFKLVSHDGIPTARAQYTSVHPNLIEESKGQANDFSPRSLLKTR